MKTLKYIMSFALVFFISCAEDDNDLSFVGNIVAPTEVSAQFKVAQDNSGLVSITPNSNGAVSYNIALGDGTTDLVNVKQGETLEHTYTEGTYTVSLEAVGLSGLKTLVNQELVVSFKAPENLVVTIENDAAISKQVNVTATADYAVSFDVYFGEPGNDTPVTANIGEVASYNYQDAGTYTIRVVAMGAAIETTEYIEEFQVTAILQPLAGAPTPSRSQNDVISIYSDVYANPNPIDYYPNWGQTTTYTQIDVNGDNIIQYGDLTYQGIDFSSVPVDASAMEFLHVDIWTANDNFNAKLSPISSGPNETAYDLELTANQWTSFDIPLSFFTDANPLVNLADIIQFKFDGVASGAGTIFVDNLYFYRAPTTTVPSVTPITFETPFALDQFDGGGTSIVTNPDTNGNNSASVLEMVKGAGQPWAGSKITIPTPFNFSNSTTVTAKVWSPRAGLNLLMKFEDNVPWPGVTGTAEITATTTLANAWETLTFDFSGIDTNIDWYNMVLIMDNGTQGDGSANYTIYIDDVSTNPMLDFEPKFELSSFDGGGISVIANPDTNGNSSSMVAEMVKGAGQPWAGSKITVPSPFNFEGATTVTVKVWSPRAGLNLLMKFEDNVPWPGVTGTAEITATTTLANAWETLTYDFSGIDTNIDWYNLVLIMDNGTQGDGSANYTIYIDDIEQN
ncbi:hypothetical protein [Gelatiniphilus marinus]|uniref:PKD/Chitinase domain-containing protein n=1 Tax=Gelatiniphilus marinus TaxID=1759464 RepID=A0ABW5JRM4_9FLAO